ncbi:MAG: hypothetical protein AAF943_17615 [Pseudomonadota bacterium]
MRALALFAATLVISAPAFASSQICGQRDAIVEQLEKKHGEYRRSIGLQSNMVVVEVFASEKGNWTILFTKPSGEACFVAVGEDWEDRLPVKKRVPGTSL